MEDRALIVLNIVLSLAAVGAALAAAWFAFRAKAGAGDETGEAVAELAEQSRTMRTMLEGLERTLRSEAVAGRSEASASAKELREEVQRTLGGMMTQMRETLSELGRQQQTGLDGFGGRLSTSLTELKTDQRATSAEFREAVQNALVNMTGEQTRRFEEFSKRIGELTQQQERAAQDLRNTVMGQLGTIQKDNESKLDQIRVTVDEKLSSTLNQRLGESFQQVSERLELVHKGLGEMQALASGVGDLKKVLTNVKTRGTWGEVQLGNLLEQVLTREQYAQNVATVPGRGERVEYAIKLPGRSGEFDSPVWLPIDSKCPQEDYVRLVEAADRGDAEAVRESAKALEARIKSCAKDISDKYISPPHTTDFGILFVPTEGLFAEVLRAPGLTEYLQRECRVMVAGPTTLAALLNSLQMGFRTLVIEKRSSEVWSVLSAVKTEFGKFETVFAKVRKKLEDATKTIDEASVRTRAVERKLKNVDQLPTTDATELLGLIAPSDSDDEEAE